MHIVELKPENDIQGITLFAFLVRTQRINDIFSLPSKYVQLISDDIHDNNVPLIGGHFELEPGNYVEGRYKHSNNIPIYNIKIIAGGDENRNVSTNNAQAPFRFTGNLGQSENENPYTLEADRKDGPEDEYILQFCYTSNEINYIGAIRICEYKYNNNQLFKASLDFGSEASQICVKAPSSEVEGENIEILDQFIGMVGGDIKKDYWQGRKDDDRKLYKSVYHVLRQHIGKIPQGELPMSKGKDSFLQSLLSFEDTDTERFLLVPNLKLLDQVNLNNPNGARVTNDPNAILTNLSIDKEYILRKILCNFLAVTMHYIKTSYPEQEYYLHYFLLMPNIYTQKKVNRIINEFYDDFNTLCEACPQFKKFKGIEVSMVSESDASFFGMRTLERIRDKRGAYYLIIDAGKGTTDFSLIHQESPNLSNFVSVYRSGIPESGHSLTYALYDALKNYFYEYNKNNNNNRGMAFNKAIRDSELRSDQRLRLASLLEKLKENYELSQEDSNIGNSFNELPKNLNLVDINNFIENKLVNENKLMPGMRNAISQAITHLTDSIDDTIIKYMKERNIVCENVILTGRAFMLRPFEQAVKKMLQEEQVVNNDEDIIYNKGEAKKICTIGAIKASEQTVINKNSNMLGCPSIIETGLDESTTNHNPICKIWQNIQKTWRKLSNREEVNIPEISHDFFYQGLRLCNVKNVRFSVSGKEMTLGYDEDYNIEIYYVGDKYIYRRTCAQSSSDECHPSDNHRDTSVRLNNIAFFPAEESSFELDDITARRNGITNNENEPHNNNNVVGERTINHNDDIER